MSNTQKPALAPGLYASPFSKAYWRDAAKELKSIRMLVLAAVIVAIRVALKGAEIPIIPGTLYITLGFFVNALGAMIYGPVMAAVGAAISDTIGALLFNHGGVYFFPFIFTEMASSVIFALFLYRSPLSNARVIWSRFCVSFFVNIVIQTPIMMMYYDMILGKSYVVFDLPRIAKNLVLFPFESILLILFLDVLAPITHRLHLTHAAPASLKIGKRQIALLLALFLVGSAATVGYGFYDYNTKDHAKAFSTEERAAYNQELTEQLDGELADGEIALVTKLGKTAFETEQTIDFNVYQVAEGTDLESLWGLKSSAAKKNESLENIATGTLVLDSETNTVLSVDIQALK